MNNFRFNILVIAGSTASGKTSLGVKLALNYNGEIISADSRQVYKGLDIGSGKDLIEYKTPCGIIPYHLIDIISPLETYTIHKYINDFYAVFEKIKKTGKMPICVGGSGLYIESILKNFQIPNIPSNPELINELSNKPIDQLTEILSEFPDELKKTDTSSKKRIIRSIIRADFLSKNPNSFSKKKTPVFKPLILITSWEKNELVERIDKRLEDRLKSGLIEEVKELLKKQIPAEILIRMGMEYKYLTLYLTDKITYNEMKEKLKISIHRLAKRQRTWFRGMEKRGLKINYIKNADYNEAINIIEQYRK